MPSYICNINQQVMPSKSVNATVRMYRAGNVGDCFLLKFSKEGKDTHIMIDCGSLGTSKKRLREIVQSIKDELKTKPLDVVVGTHQHQDHLSGYVYAQDIFQEIGIGQVWLSWLDDDSNAYTRKVKKEILKIRSLLGRSLIGLQKYVDLQQASLNNTTRAESNKRLGMVKELRESVVELLEFEGLAVNSKPGNNNKKHPVDTEHFASGKIPKTPDQAIAWLKSHHQTKYLSPGAIQDLPGFEGQVRVYILGPPQNIKNLKDMNPDDSETYDPHLTMIRYSAERIVSALDNMLEASKVSTDAEVMMRQSDEMQFPFKRNYAIREEEAKEMMAVFTEAREASKSKSKQHPSGDLIHNKHEPADALSLFFNEGNDWRRIETDWLDEIGRLALYLGNYINNSSLVMAIELVESQKVLLFPADAQTGNWRSWHNINWPGNDVTTSDLLRRTVLYKVGHHGSHNATLKAALEQMTHPELVAMIPTYEEMAAKKRPPWVMPATNLARELVKRTQNRVLRTDTGFHTGCKPDQHGRNWKSEPIVHDLYIEYSIT